MSKQGYRLPAAVLVVVTGGVLASVGAVRGASASDLLILAIGVLLLVLAITWRGWYGLYLVGLALSGWGVGTVLDNIFHPAVLLGLIGLGCGLVGAFLLRRRQVDSPRPWPLAGGIMLANLGLLTAISDPWAVFWLGWPLLIAEAAAVLGLLVVPGLLRERRNSRR